MSPPRRVRPSFPEEWHVPDNPKLWIAWEHASKKLVDEEVYCVSTSTKSGRRHAAPIWGMRKGDRLYFGTDPDSVKGLSLSANPRMIVHVQDGMGTAIEGKAFRLKGATALTALSKDYVAKYDYSLDRPDARRQVVFEVGPRVAHTWCAPACAGAR